MAGLALATPLAARDQATTLWRGGTIITMDGDQPVTAEAVVERDGKILFVGSEEAARTAAGGDARQRDLKGATLLPGFVDAHSHFAIGLQTAGGLDLADPTTGDTASVGKLLATVKSYGAKVPKGGWVVVWRYDDAQLAERRHVTRAELDSVLPDRKVVLLHVSLHGLVANSAALKAAKLRDGMKPPVGGVMPRDAKGKLTGLLFEKAMLPMSAVLPSPAPKRGWRRWTGCKCAMPAKASPGRRTARPTRSIWRS